MAYTAGNLALVSHGNGFNRYRYDTTDALTDVDASGYFNNSDDTLKLQVGDLIDVVVWDTVRTGTPSDVGLVIVLSVSAAGVVDTSNDLLGATVTDTD
jgi:hypothetical protein